MHNAITGAVFLNNKVISAAMCLVTAIIFQTAGYHSNTVH